MISKPIEIQKFFSRLFVEGTPLPAFLLREEQNRPVHLLPVMGSELVERLRFKVKPEWTPSDDDPSANLVIEWLGQVYVFRVAVTPTWEELPLPDNVYTVHRRFSDRRSVADFNLSARFLGPEKTFSGKMIDLSDAGFGFECDEDADTVPILEEIEIDLGSKETPLLLKAEVSHITTHHDSTKYLLGLRVTRAANPGTLNRFFESLRPKLFPNVSGARSDADFEKVADLLTVMAGVARLPNRQLLIQLWKSLGEGPERPGEIFLENRGGRSIATMTASRVYTKTYFLHTFAIEKREAFQLPVEMFHRMRDFAVRERGAEFTCGMWPSGHRFMERYYAEFVRRDFNPSDHHFEDVVVTRFDPSAALKSKRSEAIYNVGPLSSEDQLAVWEVIRAGASPVLFEAADWADRDLNLQSMDEYYRKAGHHRRREIITAKKNGSLVAFATVELSSGGAGVFGLANSFRIYLKEKAEPEKEVFSALIQEALRCYADQKIPACFLYAEKPWEWLSEVPGYQAALGNVSLWIVRKNRAKAFLRHMERVNWELSLFRGSKVRVRPSVLKAFDYQTEPFKPRKCMRLEDSNGIDGVAGTLKMTDGESAVVRCANLDTYGTCVILDETKAFTVGDTISLKLKLGSQIELTLQAAVRFVEARVAPGFQAQASVVGLEFIGTPIADLEKVRDYVFQKLNPDVKLFSEDDFDPLALLLQRSKYLDYFDATDHSKVIADAKATYQALSAFDSELVRTTVVRAESRAIGSHSFYKINPKTWQLHQLAIDPDLSLYKQKIPTKMILQSTFQYLCLDPGVEYMITYFNDDAAIARAYFEAGETHYNARDSAFLPCRWVPVEDLSSIEQQGRVTTCSEASHEEIVRIVESLASIVPGIEYDALSFADPTLEDCVAKWSGCAATRARKVFVARDKRNEMRVFALVNLGPGNLNFLGVLDNFRLFEVPWCNVDTRQMRLDLFSHVIAYYLSQGRNRAYFEMDERDTVEYPGLHVQEIGRTWRLIARKHAFMTAVTFFLNRYGKLEERLLAQQKRSNG